MASGTVENPLAEITQPILKEVKGTWYRLHPDQTLHFGEVMECLNLPNKAVVSKRGNIMSIKEFYASKGYVEDPQMLKPDARLVKHQDGIFLVPDGHEIKEGYPPVADENGKVLRGGYWTRVVPKEGNKEQPSGVTCDVCGKACKDEFGLKAHKRSHINKPDGG